jgi:hypothetical protein
MAESDEKQTATAGTPKSPLYRTELGRTSADSPVVKIIPTNSTRSLAEEREISARIYEIAAGLERASAELGAKWAICAQPDESKITVELAKNSQPWVAETMIEKVLAEVQSR